jgi:hypothetical protein
MKYPEFRVGVHLEAEITSGPQKILEEMHAHSVISFHQEKSFHDHDAVSLRNS